MGKKKIIAQNQEELIKEREKVDAKLQKEVKIEPRQKITEGQVYIFSSYNNTIINITDSKGNVLTWPAAVMRYGSDIFNGVNFHAPGSQRPYSRLPA